MSGTTATIIMPLYASESNEIENYFHHRHAQK